MTGAPGTGTCLLALPWHRLSLGAPCRLRQLGLTPCTGADAGRPACSNVVFSAPPSGSEDYVAEVRPGRAHARVVQASATPGWTHSALG